MTVHTYSPLSLYQLIAQLRELGDTQIVGLTERIQSDRGYYERNAIEPDDDAKFSAHYLAVVYERQIGGPITGYKGGDYAISGDQPVALAEWGRTGPYIAAVEPTRIVTVEEWL